MKDKSLLRNGELGFLIYENNGRSEKLLIQSGSRSIFQNMGR